MATVIASDEVSEWVKEWAILWASFKGTTSKVSWAVVILRLNPIKTL